ncbi:hypothetical protein CsatB_018898 [Cannabis sativa]
MAKYSWSWNNKVVIFLVVLLFVITTLGYGVDGISEPKVACRDSRDCDEEACNGCLICNCVEGYCEYVCGKSQPTTTPKLPYIYSNT